MSWKRPLFLFHRWAGIVLCAFFALWFASGMFMMYVEFPQLTRPERLAGMQPLDFSAATLTPAEALARLQPGDFARKATPSGFGAHAVEAELGHYAGQAFYRVTDWEGATRMVAGNADATTFPDAKAMVESAPGLILSSHLIDAAVLTAYDNYYYSRRPERGERPLPVIRVRFADSEHTWFHLDPLTGEVLERSTRTNRIYRWLYNGLHSFDIWWLWQRRPLWDLCVIAFSLGGLLLSCIGVTIGWRRLRPSRSRNADIRVAAEGGIR